MTNHAEVKHSAQAEHVNGESSGAEHRTPALWLVELTGILAQPPGTSAQTRRPRRYQY